MKIMVSFVKQADNAGELEAFRRHWSPKVDEVLVREMISNVGINAVTGRKQEIQGRWPCPHWFRRVVINASGELKACPVDWNDGTVCGPLANLTIYQAWHSLFYRWNRLEQLNNMHSPNSICGPCEDWRGTPWELGYEKVIRHLGTGGAA